VSASHLRLIEVGEDVSEVDRALAFPANSVTRVVVEVDMLK
jgi:hypothetical protein